MYEGIEDIYKLVEQHRLKEALVQLQGICSQTDDWILRNKVEETLTAYGYMLQYASQGMADPNRKEFFISIMRKVNELTDRADLTLQAKKQSGTFFDRFRTAMLHPYPSYSELILQLEAYTEDISTAPLLYTGKERLKKETDRICQSHETALVALFNKTWTSLHWNETDYLEAKAILTSVMVSPNDLAVMTSAATLSLFRVFDVRKMHFLMDACQHENPLVNQRAMVGMVLVMLNQEERFASFPELRSRFSLMTEDAAFCKHLQTIQLQLMLTRETEKIDKKMQEEIIPEMMKNAKKLNDPKFMFDDPEDMERNPEWSEWMDQSGMNDKLKMMGEWQMEGADVYMSSFAQLKHYPFFHEIAHWFYPFDKNQPFLEPLRADFEGTQVSPLKLITSSDFFCNSDKYSFCFALNTMPSAMREKSMQDMQAQVEMNEEHRDKLQSIMNRQMETKTYSRQYIQDLYRFFKLWKQKREEVDLFQKELNFKSNNHLFKIISEDSAFAKKLGNLLFQKEHLEEALDLYKISNPYTNKDHEVLQKIGFIYQKQKDYNSAYVFFHQADIICPDNVWTNLHLAQCGWKLKYYDDSLDYYRKVEAIEPDNLKVTLKIGQCLAKLQQYEKALSCFYKVEYLEKKPDNARRAIAWCLFMTGKSLEALEIYRKLQEGPSPIAQDWMNAGHVHLTRHNIPHALEMYRKAKEYEKEHSTFLQKFNGDREVLMKKGVSLVDILIVQDLLV